MVWPAKVARGQVSGRLAPVRARGQWYVVKSQCEHAARLAVAACGDYAYAHTLCGTSGQRGRRGAEQPAVGSCVSKLRCLRGASTSLLRSRMDTLCFLVLAAQYGLLVPAVGSLQPL